MIAAGILGAELGRSKGRSWLGPSVARRIQMAVEIARGPGDETCSGCAKFTTSSARRCRCPKRSASAFGVLVMANGDPRQTAIYAANLSGDADTVGAIACAIAGAYTGIGGFDPALIAKLDADEVFASYHVRELAEGLHRLAAERSRANGKPDRISWAIWCWIS